MSTVRHFDAIPHIVRYGMQDEEKGKSWMLFYRNATCFRVSVAREDVGSTAFGQTWLELNKEHRARELGIKKWAEQWDMLCDCIIAQCLPVLRELAPSDRQWKTLEDHLRTPTYDLKMVTVDDDAVATITSGPVEVPSYEHHLVPVSELAPLPEHVRRYQARDLIVLGQEKNWRSPPKTVQSPAGDTFDFMACNKRAKDMSSGVVSNASANRINAYSRLYSTTSDSLPSSSPSDEPWRPGVNIPKLKGIVVSGASGEFEDWDLEGDLLMDPEQEQGSKIRPKPAEPQVAGILMSQIPEVRTLAETQKIMATATNLPSTSDIANAKEKWKTQLTAAVQYLHDHGITVGGRNSDPQSSWYYINQYTVHIAGFKLGENSNDKDDPEETQAKAKTTAFEAGDAWLTLAVECTIHEAEKLPEKYYPNTQAFKDQADMDWKAVMKLFQS